MKKLIYAIFILPLLITAPLTFSAPKKGVVISVELSPAGSFEISGKLKGSIKKSKNGYIAKNISFNVSKLKTGLELRDKHTIKYLSNKGKNKKVIILKAKGKKGKGVGVIEVIGKKKKFKFTYKKVGKKYMEVKFKLSLKNFGFKGISYMGIGVADTVEVLATVPVK